jgi:hypothetical protein
MERIPTWSAIPPIRDDAIHAISGAYRVDPIVADRQTRGETMFRRKNPPKSEPVAGPAVDDVLDDLISLLDRWKWTGELRPVDLEYQRLVRGIRLHRESSELSP